jgi:hypothetical protein
MKTAKLIIGFILVLSACTSNKKTTTSTVSAHKVTKLDMLKGGTSYENAIVIKVTSESAGVQEEYKWLAESYPGYAVIRKTQTSKANKHYDIITFKTKNGEEKIVYFETTSFLGKR